MAIPQLYRAASVGWADQSPPPQHHPKKHTAPRRIRTIPCRGGQCPPGGEHCSPLQNVGIFAHAFPPFGRAVACGHATLPKLRRKLWGIATPACALVRNDIRFPALRADGGVWSRHPTEAAVEAFGDCHRASPFAMPRVLLALPPRRALTFGFLCRETAFSLFRIGGGCAIISGKKRSGADGGGEP